MTDERKELLTRMARAAYAYATERSHATWDGKRPGLSYEGAKGVQIKSCGAFRAWAILAHDGIVGWSVDGFRQRETGCETGGVCVLIGEGQFEFPVDENRSNHSLAFIVRGNGRLVGVTNESGVPWDTNIRLIVNELEAATERLRNAVREYDEAEKWQRHLKRSAEVAAASQALAATQPSPPAITGGKAGS